MRVANAADERLFDAVVEFDHALHDLRDRLKALILATPEDADDISPEGQYALGTVMTCVAFVRAALDAAEDHVHGLFGASDEGGAEK